MKTEILNRVYGYPESMWTERTVEKLRDTTWGNGKDVWRIWAQKIEYFISPSSELDASKDPYNTIITNIPDINKFMSQNLWVINYSGENQHAEISLPLNWELIGTWGL